MAIDPDVVPSLSVSKISVDSGYPKEWNSSFVAGLRENIGKCASGSKPTRLQIKILSLDREEKGPRNSTATPVQGPVLAVFIEAVIAGAVDAAVNRTTYQMQATAKFVDDASGSTLGDFDTRTRLTSDVRPSGDAVQDSRVNGLGQAYGDALCKLITKS